jgi:hypothetical protein
VTFAEPAEVVAGRLPAWLGTPEPLDAGGEGGGDGGSGGEGGCRLRGTTGDPVEWLAMRLAMLGYDFTVQEPGELVEHVRQLGARLTRAAGG